MSTSAPRPARPPSPNVENIPIELRQRDQWVCWSYHWRDGKWTKKPYQARKPGVGASSTAPSTWASFTTALETYHSHSFDGIGYVFSADDPYVGGDFDHCLGADGALSNFARVHLPATYAEISPSGRGVKYIARGTLARGRKTPRAELYASGRFFTFTGNILAGQPTEVVQAQGAIDTLLAALGSKTIKDGTPGSGSRAELAAQIPDSDWDAARELLRRQINRLLARLRASAKEETQLAYLLRGDYAGFHQKWSFVGLYRANGSLDDSQVRAVAASGIKGRGFTFPEYVALMSHLYAAKALAKWGSKERWREELAALWHKASSPRYVPKLAPQIKAPRGRAGDHHALVERVYTLLQDYRAGAAAVIKTAEIAEVIGAKRETVARILGELRDAKRIATRRLGQYGGLVITFSDVIYSAVSVAELPIAAPETDPTDRPLEETKATKRVSSDAPGDHISPPSLAAAIAEAFDAYAARPLLVPKPKRLQPEPARDSDDEKCRRVKHTSRGARRAPITRQLVLRYLDANFPALVYTAEELADTIEAERTRRKLANLEMLQPGALKAEIRLAEHLADQSRAVGDRAWRWWLVYRNAARAELAKRPPDPRRPKGGRVLCEVLPSAQEMADLRAAHGGAGSLIVRQVRLELEERDLPAFLTGDAPAPVGVSTTLPARATAPEGAVPRETTDRASEIRPPPAGTFDSLLAALRAIHDRALIGNSS